MDDEDRYTRITLRIPKELHRSLSDAADLTSKSLNAEIIGRLQWSFEDAGASAQKAAALESTLAGSRFAAEFVLKEAVQQLSLMARSNETARAVSKDLVTGLSSALDIGEELLKSETRDPKKTETELGNLTELLADAERRLTSSQLPPVQDLGNVILQKAESLEAMAAGFKAK